MIDHNKASKYFPKAYDGKVRQGDTEKTIIDVATELEINTILKRFGDWVVTTNGIECLSKNYTISKEKLDDQDWIDTVGNLYWVNESDFVLTYFSAKDLIRLGVI